MNHPDQNTTSSDSVTVEDDQGTLTRLNNLLTNDLGATVGERESAESEEMYVLPGPYPESEIHVMMGFSTKGDFSHIGTFDIDDRTATLLTNSVVK